MATTSITISFGFNIKNETMSDKKQAQSLRESIALLLVASLVLLILIKWFRLDVLWEGGRMA